MNSSSRAAKVKDMSKEDTPIKFHDFVTELLIDLAGEDDEEPGDDLKESMAELTDILFESLSFKVTGDGVAEISLP